MGRAKKTESEDELNFLIGARLREHREKRGMKLEHLAAQLGLSVAHVSSLEAGRYSFSAGMLVKLTRIFGAPAAAFLGADPPADNSRADWQRVFEALPKRDRVVLLDLAKKLASWSDTFTLQATRRPTEKEAYLISLEGIDGVLLQELGERLQGQLRRTGPVVHCSYDYTSDLWRYMMSRLAELEEKGFHQVFERTLLFACERLHRQETVMRPALHAGKSVLTPFFTMAPTVYQEMDGEGDGRLTDIIETLLLKPDLIIVVRSDPEVAAKRAVSGRPKDGQFYSPYGVDELSRALQLYDRAIDEFGARGYQIVSIQAEGDVASDERAADDLAVRIGTIANPLLAVA